ADSQEHPVVAIGLPSATLTPAAALTAADVSRAHRSADACAWATLADPAMRTQAAPMALTFRYFVFMTSASPLRVAHCCARPRVVALGRAGPTCASAASEARPDV